jgi:hypothetical protein
MTMLEPEMYLFLFMLFFHVVDDYYLQGILANLKQRSYWEERAPDKMYQHDYIVALVAHAFSWCVSIHIPVIVWWRLYGGFTPIAFLLNFIAQTAIHAIVDDLKANKKKINLITDQLVHVSQICVSFVLYCLV